MAGIRAQYFEDLEEVAKKTKQQLPNTPGEKLYRMLVGDEETLNSLGAGEWEKVKVGKYESRLVIGKTSKGNKISVAPRLIGGIKLAIIGYTLEGHSVWSDFNSSSQIYVLMHPDLDVSLWTNEIAQKQLFGQSSKYYGEALHNRWLARVWRHVFPNADIEGDNSSISAPETPKQGRAPRGENAETKTSTSAGGRKEETRARNLKRKFKEEAESGEDGGSESEQLGEDRRGVDNKLLEKYGCSNAKELWQAFNKKSERFELRDRGILSLLLRGWRVIEGVEDNRAPDLETLKQARVQQIALKVPLVSDTYPFARWRRRMQSGIKKDDGLDIRVHSNWVDGTIEWESMLKEKEAKEKEAKEQEAGEEDAVPEGFERVMSKPQEDFLRSYMAKRGVNWTGTGVVPKGGKKILRDMAEARGAWTKLS
ncbi:hypothetical protein KC318_g1473 [Hortaea werneckii]|nr:hypothetical protein KC334_g1303 [Hortaea werneckii]KAI7022367.1 hypothetical protein KC355_g2085 [Hortaea werneckii]KAI7674623.1 hypothetical protein KC318_g1473 [Hortaea werneckii]